MNLHSDLHTDADSMSSDVALPKYRLYSEVIVLAPAHFHDIDPPI